MRGGDRVGQIVRLQIQQVPIKKKGVGYFPDDLMVVDRAAVDVWGMLGWDGERWVVDAHHKAHPSRRGDGRRPLSVGFTRHYELMAERFGEAPLGIAGENIIVDAGALSLGDLGEGLVIETRSGELVTLERPRVAAPCPEFASFMLGLDTVAPRDEIEGPLADLHDGRRGFIVSATPSPTAVELASGDVVYRGVV
jgi:hypothetical protein